MGSVLESVQKKKREFTHDVYCRQTRGRWISLTVQKLRTAMAGILAIITGRNAVVTFMFYEIYFLLYSSLFRNVVQVFVIQRVWLRFVCEVVTSTLSSFIKHSFFLLYTYFSKYTKIYVYIYLQVYYTLQVQYLPTYLQLA